MSVNQFDHDIAVIGAGPVGLFAVFEAGMLDMRCTIVDALDMAGGQCTALYPEKPIYDIPGHPQINAQDLIDRLSEQAAPFNPIYRFGHQVTGLQPRPDEGFTLTLSNGTSFTARAVIIAAGCGAFGPNRPPLERLAEFEGRSVHYLVRRRDDFRDQRIVIAGGGDSAVDWAISLADIAAHVMVVHRRSKFRCAPESEKKLKALADAGRIEMVVPYQLDALEGINGKLNAVNVKTLDGEIKRLAADHLLAFFGLAMTLGPITDWGLALDHSHIKIEPATCQTSIPGIFAIGDICHYPGKLKLILSGFAEAAQAAHAARALVYPDKVLHFEYSTTRGVPGSGA